MREGSVRVGLGWWLVVKCFFKKGGVGGAGKRAGGRAKRMCHRTGKVQGYSLEHCRRILEWRSLAKLCREPTMCVRERERERVRAGGGARAGECRGGGGVGGGEGRGRGEGGDASSGLLGGRGSRRAVPSCSRRGSRRLLHARPAARLAPRLTRPREEAAAAAAAQSPGGSERAPEKSQTINPALPPDSKLLFSALGSFSPSLSRFLSLQNLEVENFTGSTLWTPLELSPNQT